MRAPRRMGHGNPVQLVAEFAGGRVAVLDLDHQVFGVVFLAADIDGHRGQELFVLSEYPRRVFTPVTWRDGRLVRMRTPAGFPISDDYVGQHGQAWWVRDGHVSSTRSVRPFHFTYDTVVTPPSYVVRAWRWRVHGLRLTPHPIGRYVVHDDDPRHLVSQVDAR